MTEVTLLIPDDHGALTCRLLFLVPPDLPRFSEPYIPLVAREIMQRMIHQFAAEYTSKTTQDDSPPPNGTMKDQSLPRTASLAPRSPAGPPPTPGSPPSSASSSPSSTPGPGLSPTSAATASVSAFSNGTGTSNGGGGTAVASAQNPVLSKLLMADQDGPLDLSVRKNQDEPEPCQQGEDNTHAGSLVHALKRNRCKTSQSRNPAQTRVQLQEVVLC